MISGIFILYHIHPVFATAEEAAISLRPQAGGVLFHANPS